MCCFNAFGHWSQHLVWATGLASRGRFPERIAMPAPSRGPQQDTGKAEKRKKNVKFCVEVLCSAEWNVVVVLFK